MPQEPAGDDVYPDWHPAAQGNFEEKPQDGVVRHGSGGAATQYTGEGAAVTQSFGTSRAGSDAEPAQEKKSRYSRRRNPNYKKGFRRPKPNPKSPFAPAMGASVHDEAGNRTRRRSTSTGAKKTLMFTEGSRLAETAPSDEYEAMLIAELGEKPENAHGGRAGRGGRVPKEPESEFTKAKNIVYNQLAASAKSRAMLEKKLQSKEISQEVIDDVLNKFEAAKLINDEEYAQMYVRDRAAGKKLSRTAIARELKSKGVAEEFVAEALEQRSEEDERADAHELVRKKMRPSMDFSDRKEKDKIMRRLVSMLARKGYSSSMAFSVVKEEIDRFIEENGVDSAPDEDFYF